MLEQIQLHMTLLGLTYESFSQMGAGRGLVFALSQGAVQVIPDTRLCYNAAKFCANTC